MDYKALFQRVMTLLSSPAKAWEEVSEEGDRQNVLGTFVYPMIALCGLSVFIGTFLESTAGFQIAMTRCCAVAVSLFGGYFLAVYIINQVGKSMLERDDEKEQCQLLVGYSLVVTFVLNIVGGLFSVAILQWILQFYTVLVVYEGARTLMQVDEEKLTRYTLIASLLVMFCPVLIKMVFNQLSVNLN